MGVSVGLCVHDSLECSARCSVWQCVFLVRHFVRSDLVMDVYHAFWQEFYNYSRDSCQMNTFCGQVKHSYLKLFPGKGEARSMKNCKLENMEHVRAVHEQSPNRFVLGVVT